jgi:hypothetical protein
LLAVVTYVSRFAYEWFSAGANIGILGAGNLFMVGMATWSIRRRKVNPHQAPEDRDRQLTFVVRTSIAVSLFAAGSISMAALELRHLQPAALSLYLQLLAVMSLNPPQHGNFEVYREVPAVS